MVDELPSSTSNVPGSESATAHRECEVADQQELRLKEMRAGLAAHGERQVIELREQRLKEKRERLAVRDELYEQKLKRKREKLAAYRKRETAEQREQRLEWIRERSAYLRQYETPEQHSRRLAAKRRAYAARRRRMAHVGQNAGSAGDVNMAYSCDKNLTNGFVDEVCTGLGEICYGVVLPLL